MCIQPCCHKKWVALGVTGTSGSWLYDLNINSGKLTNPRFVNVIGDASLQGYVAPLAIHPTTNRMYTFGHALTNGSISYLYELDSHGRTTRIGQLKAAYNPSAPNAEYTEGISGHFATFDLRGESLFAGSSNGSSRRNLKLMTINTSTGSSTAYAENYLGTAQTPEPPARPIDLVYGAAFHPTNGILYGWVSDGTTLDPYVASISTITGKFTSKVARTSSGASDFLTDMEFVKRPNGDVWAYAVGASLYRCKNITAGTPLIEKVADFTGKQGGSGEVIWGLGRRS